MRTANPQVVLPKNPRDLNRANALGGQQYSCHPGCVSKNAMAEPRFNREDECISCSLDLMLLLQLPSPAVRCMDLAM